MNARSTPAAGMSNADRAGKKTRLAGRSPRTHPAASKPGPRSLGESDRDDRWLITGLHASSTIV
jgi:hypothetical protein